MRDKACQLKPLLTDRNALSQCDTEIRECQKYIDYFNEELARLESRKDPESTSSNHLTLSTNEAGDRTSTHSSHLSPALTEAPPRSGSTEGRAIKKYSTLGIKRRSRRQNSPY